MANTRNPVIDFLHLYSPQELERLRERHTDQPDLFKPGITLGATEWRLVDLPLQLDIAITGSAAVLKKTDEALVGIRKRLVWAKRLRLTSAILAVFTGCSIIGLILSSENQAAIAVAIINLGASVLTLVAGSLESPLIGGQKSLIDYYEKLVETATKCSSLRARLLIYQNNPPDVDAADECNRVLKEVQSMANDMTQIIHKYGGPQVTKFASA